MKVIFFIIFFFVFIFKSKVISNKNIGVYSISTIYSNLNFKIKNNIIILNKYKSYFRLLKTKNGTYLIETIFKNYKLGINDLNEVVLKINFKNKLKFQWKIIKFDEVQYIVQNEYNKKLLIENNFFLQLTKNSYENINDYKHILINQKKIKFNFLKLYEESVLNINDIKIVNKEPIDVIIKYIDLTDKSLNRTGIKQFYKDKDNEEIKYSIKSILENISWIRKIFILMPNEKVNFLKSIDEIKDKIIYVKDKELLGFESANIQSFLFNLYKMESFGVSKNFIYMEDDYFIGKKLSKKDFFYYERDNKKVVPYIISSVFSKINKTEILNKYYEFLNRSDYIRPHSKEGFWHQIYNTEKFVIENFNTSLINVFFTHNSIPLNIDDLIIICNKSKKYVYINETIYNKQRNVLSLCFQHLSNLINLNINHRKVHSIYHFYISIEDIKRKKLNKALFVLNTGGNHIPLNREYKIQKKIMIKRFPFQNIYDAKKKKNIFLIFLKIIFILIIKIYIILIFIKIII